MKRVFAPRRELYLALTRFQALLKRSRHAIHALAYTPRLFGLAWQSHPWYTASLLLLNVVRGVMPLTLMWIVRLIIDSVVSQLPGYSAVHKSDSLNLGVILGLLFVISSLSQIIEPICRFIQQELGECLAKEVNSRILRKVSGLFDITALESPNFHNLLERTGRGANYRPMQIIMESANVLRNSVGFVSMLVVLLLLQPVIALGIVSLSLPHIVIQFRQIRRSWMLNNVQIPQVRRMGYLSTILTSNESAKEVRLFGLSDYFLRQFDEQFERFRAEQHAFRMKQLAWNLTLSSLSSLGYISGYVFTVIQAITGTVTIGEFTLYTAAISQVQGNLLGIIGNIVSLYEGSMFARDFFGFLVLEACAGKPSSGGLAIPLPLQIGIEFRHVSFHYPGSERNILDDVNFLIRPYQTVALVGENGAGKTTLVKLLTRLYDPTEGTILIDGVDLREYDVGAWRQQVGTVLQDFCRYHTTARENIGIGRVQHVDDLGIVGMAAECGGATELISRLSNGYETSLGRWLAGIDEGADLSGGEWQKIALSRAFMRSVGASTPVAGHEAQLFVLDEPTAALDAQAEFEAYSRFHEIIRGKAGLLISHRFSTVRMADLIVVLENGRITEQGTHKELLAQGRTYARLYNIQADYYR